MQEEIIEEPIDQIEEVGETPIVEDKKFSIEEVEKTFTRYKNDTLYDALIVSIRPDGFIVNIGGKSDAFVKNEEYSDFENAKIGDSFKAKILKPKNDEGFVEVSKNKAKQTIDDLEKLKEIKIGSKFSCVIISANKGGLVSKLGNWEIFVPSSQILSRNYSDYVGKDIEVVCLEFDDETKKIVASKRILEEESKREKEDLFWRAIFENKIVNGRISRFVPFGAFVDVDGVECLLHISEISHERIASPDEKLCLGETMKFRVIKVDRENKKVSLSLRALEQSKEDKLLKELNVGETRNGEVIKILQFGALVKIDNGLTGLLHISHATDDSRKNIYEIVKVGEKIDVKILDIDLEKKRISLSL